MPKIKYTTQQYLYLSNAERVWVTVYNDLLSQGYRLRARYHPDWIPSWMKTGITLEDVRARGLEGEFEDCIPLPEFNIQAIDATQVVDGKQVWLKYVAPEKTEPSILQAVSSGIQCEDSRNHCAALLDTLSLPRFRPAGSRILVMPMYRDWHNPALHLVVEAMDLIDQLLNGLAFLHRQNVTHGDIKSSNIMMDAWGMFPDGFNPLVVGRGHRADSLQDEVPRGSRIEVPVKYVYIDFGYGHKFESFDARHAVEWTGGYGQLPEIDVNASGAQLFDPFPADVRALGHFIFDLFCRNSPTLIPPIAPLVLLMVDKDPLRRPTAEQCVSTFRDATAALSWSLCSRLPPIRLYTWDASQEEMRDTARREENEYLDRLIRFLQVCDGRPRLLSQVSSRPAFCTLSLAAQRVNLILPSASSPQSTPTSLTTSKHSKTTTAASDTIPPRFCSNASKHRALYKTLGQPYRRVRAYLQHLFRKDSDACV